MRAAVDNPDTDLEVLTFEADLGDAGRRLDHAVLRHAREISGVSRTRVQRWIVDGFVTMNSTPVLRAGATVPSSARISVALPPSARRRQRPGPEPGPLDIVFEDDQLLVLNKPAGLVVHPSYRNTTGTLLNRVLWHLRHHGSLTRPGLVSRLDKDTSGLVVVALTHDAHAQIQRAADQGRVRKEYLAIVGGHPTPTAGRIMLPLRRDADDRRRVVVADDGAASETRYNTLDATSTAALLRCELVTGRTHQIRVHLAASECPILGDATYGVPVETLRRQALHAWRCALPHPLSGDRLTFYAPLPDDLQRAATALGLAVPGEGQDRRVGATTARPTTVKPERPVR